MPALRYSTPEGIKIHPLRETFTIGRDAQNDLALPDDPKVSHQHARIRHVSEASHRHAPFRHVEDTYVIEDLQSTNGTFLERDSEDTRITAPQQLRPNDVIRVGSTRLVFEMLGETRVGRWLPEFLQPPEGFAPTAPSAEESAPAGEESSRRIAELEQQLAELKAQLAKKQG